MCGPHLETAFIKNACKNHPMPVNEFEFFHGLVLAKLIRRPDVSNLMLIEFNKQESSIYRVNDDAGVFVTYSTSPRSSKKDDSRSWTFNVSPEQRRQIGEQSKRLSVYMALVCGSQKFKYSEYSICALNSSQWEEILGADLAAGSITVRLPAGGGFRIFKDRRECFIVPRNSLQAIKFKA
jgi:hypothetical protein